MNWFKKYVITEKKSKMEIINKLVCEWQRKGKGIKWLIDWMIAALDVELVRQIYKQAEFRLKWMQIHSFFKFN